jgi:hypothetical protein
MAADVDVRRRCAKGGVLALLRAKGDEQEPATFVVSILSRMGAAAGNRARAASFAATTTSVGADLASLVSVGPPAAVASVVGATGRSSGSGREQAACCYASPEQGVANGSSVVHTGHYRRPVVRARLCPVVAVVWDESFRPLSALAAETVAPWTVRAWGRMAGELAVTTNASSLHRLHGYVTGSSTTSGRVMVARPVDTAVPDGPTAASAVRGPSLAVAAASATASADATTATTVVAAVLTTAGVIAVAPLAGLVAAGTAATARWAACTVVVAATAVAATAVAHHLHVYIV